MEIVLATTPKIKAKNFSESLVHKDYKKICLHFFVTLLLWKRVVSFDVIIVTVIKIFTTLESDVLYIIRKIM